MGYCLSLTHPDLFWLQASRAAACGFSLNGDLLLARLAWNACSLHSLPNLVLPYCIPINRRVAQEVEAGRLKMRQTKGGMDRTDRRPAGTAAQKAE